MWIPWPRGRVTTTVSQRLGLNPMMIAPTRIPAIPTTLITWAHGRHPQSAAEVARPARREFVPAPGLYGADFSASAMS